MSKRTKKINIAVESGAVESGAVESGAVESGAIESGAVESGAIESGAVESGAVESGAGTVGDLLGAAAPATSSKKTRTRVKAAPKPHSLRNTVEAAVDGVLEALLDTAIAFIPMVAAPAPTQLKFIPSPPNHLAEYMHLKVFVDNAELKTRYIKHINNHNSRLQSQKFVDSGFDIFTTQDFETNQRNNWNTLKMNFGIQCAAQMMPNLRNTGFYIYPRSSLTKTWLRLANSAGIIDAGYRGHLLGVFDTLELNIDQLKNDPLYEKITQICAPNLLPIYVELVDTFEELGETTERAFGGFGSTNTETSSSVSI